MEGVPAVEHTEVCVVLHTLADRAFKLADVAAVVCHCSMDVLRHHTLLRLISAIFTVAPCCLVAKTADVAAAPGEPAREPALPL
jgi:hypothetical protein